MSIQAIREQARKALHETMARPANLFLNASATDAHGITARYHAKSGLVGDLSGTNLSYAETHDDEETVVFWRSQLVPLFGEPGTPPAIAFA